MSNSLTLLLADLAGCLFAALCLITAWKRKIKNIYLLHAMFYFVFMQGLQFAWRMSNGIYTYDTWYYTWAHVACALYMIIFLALAPRIKTADGQRLSALEVFWAGQKHTTYLFVIWFLGIAFLASKYGLGAVARIQTADNMSIVPIANLDVAIRQITEIIGQGAFLLVITRAIYQPRSVRPFDIGFSLVFVLLSFGLGAASFGVRRGMIMTIGFAGLVYLGRAYGGTRRLSQRQIAYALAAVLLLLVGSSYYQSIRLNPGEPHIKHLMSSADWGEKLEGIALMLTPMSRRRMLERTGWKQAEGEVINRAGPFDLLYGVIQTRNEKNLGTDGILTWMGIVRSLPSAFVGEKPSYGEDNVIMYRMRIIPNQMQVMPAHYFENMDYSASILAFLYADFGPVSIIIAPVLTLVFMTLVINLAMNVGNSTFVQASALGSLYWMAGSVEGSIVPVMIGLRNFILLLLIGTAIKLLTSRTKSPTAPAAVTPRQH